MGETKEMRKEVWRSHKAIATAQAKEWSQQVGWAAEPLEIVNCQSTSCCFTSVFCVSCKFLLISNLSWYHKGEEKRLQFSSFDTIGNHQGNRFRGCLRKVTYTLEPWAAQHGPEWPNSQLPWLGLSTLRSRSGPARETH